jgi:hypothetical protein
MFKMDRTRYAYDGHKPAGCIKMYTISLFGSHFGAFWELSGENDKA